MGQDNNILYIEAEFEKLLIKALQKEMEELKGPEDHIDICRIDDGYVIIDICSAERAVEYHLRYKIEEW